MIRRGVGTMSAPVIHVAAPGGDGDCAEIAEIRTTGTAPHPTVMPRCRQRLKMARSEQIFPTQEMAD